MNCTNSAEKIRLNYPSVSRHKSSRIGQRSDLRIEKNCSKVVVFVFTWTEELHHVPRRKGKHSNQQNYKHDWWFHQSVTSYKKNNTRNVTHQKNCGTNYYLHQVDISQQLQDIWHPYFQLIRFTLLIYADTIISPEENLSTTTCP